MSRAASPGRGARRPGRPPRPAVSLDLARVLEALGLAELGAALRAVTPGDLATAAHHLRASVARHEIRGVAVDLRRERRNPELARLHTMTAGRLERAADALHALSLALAVAPAAPPPPPPELPLATSAPEIRPDA